MATSVSKTNPKSNSLNSFQSLASSAAGDAEDLKMRIGSIVAKTAQKIAADFKKRKEGFSGDVKLLESGCWYPNDYCFALRSANQTVRLTFFINNGSFYHGFPNTKKTGLEYIPFDNATGKMTIACRLPEKGIKASDAIKAFQENLVLADCAQLCQVSQYQALLEILGEERFNKLFSSASHPKDRLVISSYAVQENSLLVFLKQKTTKEKDGFRVLEVGQRVAFENFQIYGLKHLNGEAGGFNTICVDATPSAPKFVALGTPPEGLTEEGINSLMVEEYNKTPVDFSIFSSEIEKKIKAKFNPRLLPESQKLKDHKLTVLDLKAEVNGFQPSLTLEFNMDMVLLALATPLDKLSIEFLEQQRI